MDIKLGFGEIPKPQYIFVSRENDYCWYKLGEEEKHFPIYDKALTGIVTKIEIGKKIETSFGELEKTDLHVLADKPYVVRSGTDSYFSKSLLLSLNALSVEELQRPVTITVNPGDKKVVFCRIYDPATYRAFEISWEEHKVINWEALGQKVSTKINCVYNKQASSIENEHQKQISGHSSYSVQKLTTELRNELIAQTNIYLAQIHWTPQQGQDFLKQKYRKRSRQQLTDEELLDFIDYLKLHPNHLKC